MNALSSVIPNELALLDSLAQQDKNKLLAHLTDEAMRATGLRAGL